MDGRHSGGRRRGARLDPRAARGGRARKREGALREDRPLKAKKSLGQNFLVDDAVRDAILEAAAVTAGDEVLEIGPGRGVLTEGLVERARRLVAVELDRRLVPALRARFPAVEVVEADVLRVDLAQLFPGGGEVVVGNIPYYLTGALLPRLLDHPPRPRRIVLLVQREVAERWTAPTCESVATLAVKTFTDARLAFVVPPDAFDPRPKVWSALVVMEVLAKPRLAEPDAVFRLAERVFQFRRKQLGASLRRVTGAAAEDVVARLNEAGIEPSQRPQELSVAEWARVHRAFAG